MKQNETPITETALQQLEIRKKALSDYSMQMVALFTEKVKSTLDRAILEIEHKQRELIQFCSDRMQSDNSIINPEEPAGKKTGKEENGKQ